MGTTKIFAVTKAAMLFAVATLLPFSAQSQIQQRSSSFSDSRDGQEYLTRIVGSQTWMAENLNYKAVGSECYDESEANCARYGRLYDWDAAKAACPRGWHLPTQGEWGLLMGAVGGVRGVDSDGDVLYGGAGGRLKSRAGWNANGGGSDEVGFSALPSGAHNIDGSFSQIGDAGYWWSATASDAAKAYLFGVSNNNDLVYELSLTNRLMIAVRCVQDGGSVPMEPASAPAPQYAPPPQAPAPQYAPPPQAPAPQYAPPPQAPAPQYAQPPAPQSYGTSHQGYRAPAYENFGGGTRFATWLVNWVIPGVGSCAIMQDWTGAVAQWTFVGLGCAFVVVGVNAEANYDGSNEDDEYKGIAYMISGAALLVTNFVYNIVRSASYEKPRPINYSGGDYGNLNLAVFPDKHGNVKAGVVYNLEF